MKRAFGLAVLVGAGMVLGISSLAPAAAPTTAPATGWEASPLAKTVWGELLNGADPSKMSLKGKVLLLVYWSPQQYSSVQMLPSLQDFAEDYKRDGLIVVASDHNRMRMGPFGAAEPMTVMAMGMGRGRGGAGRGGFRPPWGNNGGNNPTANMTAQEVVTELLKFRKVDYSIVADAAVPAVRVPAVPSAMLFGHDGKVAWSGSLTADGVTAMTSAVVKALKTARLVKIVGDREYVFLKATVQKIFDGQLAPAYKQCKALEDKDGAPGEEARALLSGLDAYAQEEVDKSNQARSDAPSEVVKILQQLKTEFTGTSWGDKADEMLKALAKDEQYKRDCLAEKEYNFLLDASDKIPAMPTDEKDMPAWKAKNRANVKELAARVNNFRKKYPDSPFGARLDEVVKSFGGMD